MPARRPQFPLAVCLAFMFAGAALKAEEPVKQPGPLAVTGPCAGAGPTVALRERARELIGLLDADQFAAREEASTALEALGPQALPILNEALDAATSAEVRRRLRRAIDAVGKSVVRPDGILASTRLADRQRPDLELLDVQLQRLLVLVNSIRDKPFEPPVNVKQVTLQKEGGVVRDAIVVGRRVRSTMLERSIFLADVAVRCVHA